MRLSALCNCLSFVLLFSVGDALVLVDPLPPVVQVAETHEITWFTDRDYVRYLLSCTLVACF